MTDLEARSGQGDPRVQVLAKYDVSWRRTQNGPVVMMRRVEAMKARIEAAAAAEGRTIDSGQVAPDIERPPLGVRFTDRMFGAVVSREVIDLAPAETAVPSAE